MDRRLYLHIGLPKTGTTYLQSCVWANRDALRERGLLVPGRGQRRHLLASMEFREDPKLADRPGDTARPWQDLLDEIANVQQNALITHEFFAAASRDQISAGLDRLSDRVPHVLITARPGVDLFISRWQEWIKNGNSGTIDEYPPSGARATGAWGLQSFDLADVLKRWGSVLPHEQIHVIPARVGDDQPESLWHRFLRVMEVDPTGLEAPVESANTSLGIQEVELLRRVNEHLAGRIVKAQDRGFWVRRYLGETLLWREGGERFRPGAEKLAEVQARADEALELLETGGYALHGRLSDLTSGSVEGRRHPSEVTAEEMLGQATEALAAAVVELRDRARETPEDRGRSGWWGRIRNRGR